MNQDAPAPSLVLINGAPVSGKSTLTALLAAQTPLTLALDIDMLKQSLGGWDRDLHVSGLQARRLAAECGARFVEVALTLDEATLMNRLRRRREHPDRPEQARNDRFVGPEGARELMRT